LAVVGRQTHQVQLLIMVPMEATPYLVLLLQLAVVLVELVNQT